MDEEELSIIKIPLNIFKCQYINYVENNEEENYNNIKKKAAELVDNYICFTHSYDAKRLSEKKKKVADMKKQRTRQRPHILLFDFTDESKCKKEFTSYLNKLTDINKDVIYTKIKSFIHHLEHDFILILLDILWNFIKISSNNIYIDILYLFDPVIINNFINNKWNNYLENKEWLPPEFILNNLSILKDDNYDDFCKYIKWKKNNISITRTLCYIFKKENKIDLINLLINNIIVSIELYLLLENRKNIIDLLLDQLNILLIHFPNQSIINKINNWDLNKYEKSSKFKIMNIIDKYR